MTWIKDHSYERSEAQRGKVTSPRSHKDCGEAEPRNLLCLLQVTARKCILRTPGLQLCYTLLVTSYDHGTDRINNTIQILLESRGAKIKLLFILPPQII